MILGKEGLVKDERGNQLKRNRQKGMMMEVMVMRVRRMMIMDSMMG